MVETNEEEDTEVIFPVPLLDCIFHARMVGDPDPPVDDPSDSILIEGAPIPRDLN